MRRSAPCSEKNGRPFRTRGGKTVRLKDLLDEAQERALTVVTEKQPDLHEDRRRAIAHSVGIGAIKYSDLSKDRVSDYMFSFDKMLALDGNTAPYLQYAHARVRSIFRKAGDAKPGAIRLESPFELALAKHILRLGEIIDLVARELKPHHLCAYLYELATRFSGFFENCPVIQSEPPPAPAGSPCAISRRERWNWDWTFSESNIRIRCDLEY